MYKIGTLNKISPVGLNNFSEKYSVSSEVSSSVGIILRSQDIHEMEFEDCLLAIARAGAGVNNIPIDRCSEKGIVVFNTPGANANSVKELVLGGLVLASRNLYQGINWAAGLEENVAKEVEKGKKQFAGNELCGKTLGVVGLGAIGFLVAKAAYDLGMNIVGYDPYLPNEKAVDLPCGTVIKDDIKDLLPLCDYVTLHVPANDKTKGMFNKELLDLMKDNAVLLNFARDKLINEEDLVKALEDKKIREYITDFPTDGVLGKEGVIAIPHLGASTEEAEDNCAVMAVRQTMDYIENGNVVNSVNLPKVDLGPIGKENRVAIVTKGEPYPAKLIAAMFANKNITAVAGGVKGDYGYALITTPDFIDEVPKVDGVIKVRVIQPDDK